MRPSDKTFKLIWGQFAAKCAICHKSLIRKAVSKKPCLVGEVAHIIGESKRAARGSHPMPLARRNEPNNLLLLCREDHKIIDDDESAYTIAKVHAIREEYVQWLESQLAEAKPWKTNISQHCYLNVPRLCELGQMEGHSVDLSEFKDIEALYSMGWELNRVLLKFKDFLPQLSLSAVPLESLEYTHKGYVGALVSFNGERFRTKNIPGNPRQAQKYISKPHSCGLMRAPHIYSKRGSWKLILTIDPRWITTTTAFVLFKRSGGQSRFAGLTRITKVDYENNWMLGTPLALGIPRGPLD